jgi:hypothetical protein
MRKTQVRNAAPAKIGKAASVVLILSVLATFTGCMGFSQSGSGSGGDQSGNLVLGSSTLDFGDVTINSTKTLTVTASNPGNKTINVSSVSFSTKYFAISSPTLPVSVAAGQSVTLSISFTPNAATNFTATVSIASDASNGTQTVALSGSGTTTTQLQINPTTAPFGSVNVGSSKSQVVTLNNATSSSISVSKVTVGGTGFSLSGITTPVTLAALKSTTFTITFSPKASGYVTGSAIISSDAANSSITIPLSGTGEVVVPGALSANPTSLSFGNVNVGSTGKLSETITNTGGSSVSVTQVGVTGTGFSVSGITTPLTLNAGQSTTFTVSFAPGAGGSSSGNLTITSTGSNPSLTVPVSGKGVTVAAGALGASPTSLNFGSVNVGSTGKLSETITNTGGSSVSVNQVGVTGTGFSVSGIATPLTLNAGQSTTFTVSFAPGAGGSSSGNLTVTSTASNPSLTVPVSGTGVTAAVGQLSVSPGTLALGNATVGSSSTANGTVTASGASVTVTGASTNNSVFTIGGFSLPHTIPAGQSASFTITFSPTVAGSAGATLTFTSNAQPTTTTESLTGTGVAVATHSVALSWSASTSSNISGYNVYRATYSSSCGSFSKINSLLDTGTLYTDSSVKNGSSYCYATTAVDTSNVESGYSNIVSNVQIPAQ